MPFPRVHPADMLPSRRDPFNKSALILPGEDFFSRMQHWLAERNSGTLGNRARENLKLLASIPPMNWDDRVQHVQVMCAANTIIAVLLIGIVVLQVCLNRCRPGTKMTDRLRVH